MFTHIMIGTNDVDKARPFYEAALGALGHKNLMPPAYAGMAFRDESGAVVITTPANGKPATASNGATISFRAPDNASIDAFHAAGLANGGADEGAPGIRTGSGKPVYGAYLRDPDGNKLAAFAPEAQ